MTTTTFYWRDKPNFGDYLGPLLLDYFADVSTIWVPAPAAQIVSVGSLLHIVGPEYKGIVLGSGKLFEDTPTPKHANILGLRGPLSAMDYKGEIAIGDPGLLADELVTVEKRHDLGIVPHWSDRDLEHRPEFKKYHPLIIRPESNPLDVLRKIGSCRKIVSSSLHGIIVADAFGIPRRTEMTARFATEGGSFKFRDYNASVGVPFRIGVTQEPARHVVQERQHEIFDSFQEAGDILRQMELDNG